jgi:hypothetical protein
VSGALWAALGTAALFFLQGVMSWLERERVKGDGAAVANAAGAVAVTKAEVAIANAQAAAPGDKAGVVDAMRKGDF